MNSFNTSDNESEAVVINVLEFLKKIHSTNKNNVYRGQKNSDWELLPSIHRKRMNKEIDLVDHEKKLYKNIRKQNLEEFKKQDQFINEVIKMQHYGIPTPLIDWTTNPLIALFFATDESYKSDHEKDKDGKVFIANYNEQNKIGFDTEKFRIYSNFLEKIYTESKTERMGQEILKDGNIIFLETINENNRIKAQRGLFSFDTLPYLKDFYDFEERIKYVLNVIKNEDVENMIKKYSNIKNIKKNNSNRKSYEDEIFDEILSTLKNMKIIDDTVITDKLIKEIESFKIKDALLKNIEKFLNPKLIQKIETTAIIIPSEHKKSIRNELEKFYGIDSSTVYPDVQGYIDYIKENY